MSKSRSAVLILCMSTVCLSGCDLIRVAGPCYGVGCPTGTEGRNGQYKPGEAPKPQNASAPASTKPAAPPVQSASATAKPAAAVQPAPRDSASPSAQSSTTASAPAQAASAQATPVQDASAETKSSPFHAIGEFFERLIPHHNSGANSSAGSGASN